jgi:hypothetical protein
LGIPSATIKTEPSDEPRRKNPDDLSPSSSSSPARTNGRGFGGDGEGLTAAALARLFPGAATEKQTAAVAAALAALRAQGVPDAFILRHLDQGGAGTPFQRIDAAGPAWKARQDRRRQDQDRRRAEDEERARERSAADAAIARLGGGPSHELLVAVRDGRILHAEYRRPPGWRGILVLHGGSLWAHDERLGHSRSVAPADLADWRFWSDWPRQPTCTPGGAKP